MTIAVLWFRRDLRVRRCQFGSVAGRFEGGPVDLAVEVHPGQPTKQRAEQADNGDGH